MVSCAARSVEFDPTVCATPRDFWRHYDLGPPDVIWMGMIMPDADGIEMVQALAERGCQAAIVMMTGSLPLYAEAAARVGGLRGLRFSALLQKPTRTDRIRRAIREGFDGVVDESVPDLGLPAGKAKGRARAGGRRS